MAFFIALAIPTIVGAIQAIGAANANADAARQADEVKHQVEEQARRAAQAARDALEVQRQEALRIVQEQERQVTLYENVLNTSSQGQPIIQLLQQLSDETFRRLGNEPISRAPNEEAIDQYSTDLQNERTRRHIYETSSV